MARPRGEARIAARDPERRTMPATSTPTEHAAATRAFDALGRDDVPYAGGKGANLGELTAAGMPVPPGFVVGAPAYAAFIAETGLRERLAQVLDGLDVDDT